MRPLIYGYMRVTDEMSDEEVQHKEEEMRTYAESEDCTLASVFYEYAPGQKAAFEELVETLQRNEARRVVVPSLRDLASTTPLQTVMLMHVEHAVGAEVFELDEADG